MCTVKDCMACHTVNYFKTGYGAAGVHATDVLASAP